MTAKRIPEPELFVGQEKKKFGAITKQNEIKAAIESGTILRGNVTMVEKDRVYVQIGDVTGVIPASEYDAHHKFKNLDSQVWRPIMFKIKGFDEVANLAACSRKEAQLEMEKATWDSIKAGDICSGVVVGMSDRAAYLDIGGGVTAILPCAQMHHSRPAHPSEMVQTGEYFDVQVLKIKKKPKSVIVGLKQLLPSPWDTFLDKYTIGMSTAGVIRSVESFGLFVELEPGLVALAPHADIPYVVGDKVRVQIIKLDANRKRIKVLVKAKSNWGFAGYGGGMANNGQ